MNFVVLKDFTDLQDNRHVYHAGDSFPRNGVEVSEERVAELASADNKRGVALIKSIEVESESAQKGEIQPVSDEIEVFDEDIATEEKTPKKRKKREK